ncbi:MAG: DUF5357 domain-containing protein [Pseudanabaenales cyanobacterium]|nr:DUF5357 domain-containing protein [Pseudanabaenales cyanobacterium]
MQPLNQLVNLLKPPEVFSWQTLILLGSLSWLLFLAAVYTDAEPSTVDLLVTVSWLLTTAGGGCLVYTFLKPPRYFSWQTVILLGLFSWLTSVLAAVVNAAGFTVNLLGIFSLLFFTIGVGWALSKHPIKVFGVSIGPWITGAILCAFIFTPWVGNNIVPAVVSWPLVSVLIAATPHFLTWNLTFKVPLPPIRQNLILLLLLNLLFSSWIEFSFLIQNWLDDYPSLIMDDFGQSGFVYVLPTGNGRFSQGEILLDTAGSKVKDTLNEMPWPDLERWLLNADDRITPIGNEARERLMALAEQDFWELRTDVDGGASDSSDSYNLKLQAFWLGPASKPEGYYLEKACQITQKLQPIADAEGNEAPSTNQIVEYSTPLAHVECDLGVSDMQWINPS